MDQILCIIVVFAFSIYCFFESKKSYKKLIETEWSESDWINARIRPQKWMEHLIFLYMAYGVALLIAGIIGILLFTGVMQI